MRKIIVIMISGILCFCCKAEIGFPNGTYQISEKGQKNAEIMRDTAMFYYYLNHKKQKEAENLLQAILDRRPDAIFLLYTCAKMYSDRVFPEENFIALAKRHPEAPALNYIFAEALESNGKKKEAFGIVENALSYRLDPPSEGEEPRGKKEKWMSDDLQVLVRVYLSFLYDDEAYQKGGEFLKKLFSVYSREKLKEETLIYLVTFAFVGQEKAHKEYFQREFERYITMLKERMAGPNTYSYVFPGRFIPVFINSKEQALLEALLTESLLTNPGSEAAYRNLGMLYLSKFQQKCRIRALSLEIIAHMLRTKQIPSRQLVMLFEAALEAGDEKTISLQLGRMMRMNLMNDELYYKLSYYHLAKNNIPKARSYCAEIKNPEVRNTLMGFILNREKKYREAMLLYMKLERNNTKNPFLKMSVADFAKKAGDKEVESQFRNEMIMKIDQLADYQNFIAYTWAEQGIKLDQAEAYLKMALKAEPSNYAYLDSMAWVYYRQKNYQKAKDYILKALSLCKDSVVQGVLCDHAGDIFSALGDRKKALFYWQKAVQSGDPDLDIDAVMKKLPRPYFREIKPVQNPVSKADGPRNVPSAPQTQEPLPIGNKG